jgi:hypothetical protein
MAAHDWILPARICPAADSLYRTAQAIFHNLDGSVTPELVAAALEALGQYRAELASDLDPMHYGVPVGTHVCVEFVYQEATARLRCLLAATIQPAPQPPAPPPPQPKPRSLADVVKEFAGLTDAASDAADTDNGE